MHLKGGAVGEKGRLQFRALQKEVTTGIPLRWSRGGGPGIGGWQRPAPLAPTPWPEPSSQQPADHRVRTGKGGLCMGGRAGGQEDARLNRYPPYPNGATARWPCLAEDHRYGRGRGAGWSSGLPPRFQPWQPDWGVRAWGPAKTLSWGWGLRCAHHGSDAPSSLKGIGDQPQGV